MNALSSRGLCRAEHHPDRRRVRRPRRICAIPSSRSRSSHASPSTSLTRQPWQNGNMTDAPSRRSWTASINALASVGERARPAFTRFARGALTRSNGLAGISLNYTASVKAWRQTFRQLSTVYGAYLSRSFDCHCVNVSGPMSTTAWVPMSSAR